MVEETDIILCDNQTYLFWGGLVVLFLFIFDQLGCLQDKKHDEPPKKRCKLETEDGERIISTFLENVRKLSLRDDISEADMKNEFEKMKSTFISCDNEYVQSIVSTIL